MDKMVEDTKKLQDEIKETSKKVSESYEKTVEQLVFKDFKEKADKLEKDRKGSARIFIGMIVFDIAAIIGCSFLTAYILKDKTLGSWEFFGQSLLITSPILVLLLWATKYFNRRTHELAHLKEEYEYKFLSILVFDGYKETIQRYGDPMVAEYLMRVIQTITENPTLCLYHKQTDAIPKNEFSKIISELNSLKTGIADCIKKTS